MPSLKKSTRKNYLPKRTAQTRAVDNSKLYKSKKWTKLSLSVRKEQKICPIEKAVTGFPIQVMFDREGVCDHIIPMIHGGAEYDKRNLIGMSRKWHDKKSGLEATMGALVGWKYNEDGDKIPRRREDIIDFFVDKYGTKEAE